jgi:hypothetical protein
MCLAVYLASSQSIPTSEWNESTPAFYLQTTAEGEPARKQFSYPYVYYVGSHEGCGCGFSKDFDFGEDLDASQQDYAALGRLLRDATVRGAKLELFTCWEGEQSSEPESVSTITASEIEAQAYELRQLELLRVEEADA